jgi:hypothetical protein
MAGPPIGSERKRHGELEESADGIPRNRNDAILCSVATSELGRSEFVRAERVQSLVIRFCSRKPSPSSKGWPLHGSRRSVVKILRSGMRRRVTHLLSNLPTNSFIALHPSTIVETDPSRPPMRTGRSAAEPARSARSVQCRNPKASRGAGGTTPGAAGSPRRPRGTVRSGSWPLAASS